MEKRKNIVDFRGPRMKTANWSPRKKFETFSDIRMKKLEKIMKSVRNLSNKKYYDYTETEKKIIMRKMGEWYQDMYRAWKTAGKKGKNQKKQSFWDSVNNGNS